MKSIFAGAAVLAVAGIAQTAAAAQPLVDAAWLEGRLGQENLVVLDIRSQAAADAPHPYAQGHIPGAVNADYNALGWRTTVDGVPGMLPEVATLESLIGGLGVDGDDHVVIVPPGENSSDFSAAARVYWTFKVLGHDEVSILNGGHAGWAADAENPLSTESAAPKLATFTAEFRPELLATVDEVAAAVADGSAQLVDGRPVEQFRGEAKHPQSRVAGTLPGAVNLDNRALTKGGYFIDEAALKALLADAGTDAGGEKIAFCNTGHWASIAWFALSEVGGQENVSLYDGSMVQWTADASRPVANSGQ